MAYKETESSVSRGAGVNGMRILVLLITAAGLALLAGCGGGHGAAVVSQSQVSLSHRLELNFLNQSITVPQGPSSQTQTYSISTKLWMAQTDPLFAGLQLGLPFMASPLTVGGPNVVPPDDSTDQDTVPTLLYWGQGSAIPSGQPEQVNPGQWMPGYQQPESGLYQYAGGRTLNSLEMIAGAYQLASGVNTMTTWTLPIDRTMLNTTTFSSPTNIIVNNTKPLVVTWSPVQGAIGYLVDVEGDLKDHNNNVIGHVAWDSTTQPIMFIAVHSYLPYLLPSSTTSVTIPAYTFTNCQAITINLLACGNPYDDNTTNPTFHVVSGSLTTSMYVLYTPQTPRNSR